MYCSNCRRSIIALRILCCDSMKDTVQCEKKKSSYRWLLCCKLQWNCRRGQWTEGLSWVPCRSQHRLGKCRPLLTCHCSTLQHHQDSLPAPAPASPPPPAGSRRSRRITPSTSRQPPDRPSRFTCLHGVRLRIDRLAGETPLTVLANLYTVLRQWGSTSQVHWHPQLIDLCLLRVNTAATVRIVPWI